MKKLVIMVLIAILAFVAYQKKAERKRELLVGKWAFQQNVPGGAIRALMNVKPEGTIIISLDGTISGHPIYFQTGGTWNVQSNSFITKLDRGDIPGFKPGKLFGGPILKLDDTDLSYTTTEGVESWKRTP